MRVFVRVAAIGHEHHGEYRRVDHACYRDRFQKGADAPVLARPEGQAGQEKRDLQYAKNPAQPQYLLMPFRAVATDRQRSWSPNG